MKTILNKLFQVLHRIRYHIMAWGTYTMYEVLVAYILFGPTAPAEEYVIHYSITIFLFYIFALYAMPWALKPEASFKAPRLLLAIFVYITLYLLLHSLANLITTGGKSALPEINKDYLFRNIYRGLNFMGFAITYYIFRHFAAQKKRAADLEKQLLEDTIRRQAVEKELSLAQTAFLKAQINPHFLFNTLDFVYHEVNDTSPRAGTAILSLSNMMRYALDAGEQGERLLLGQELEQAEELIRLHQLRKDQQLQLQLTYSPELKELRIIPLLLLTLVENIFKHADLMQAEVPAELRIERQADDCCFISRNTAHRLQKEQRQGQGLQNLSRRLALAYGPDARLQYGSRQGHFELELRIPVALMNGSPSS